MRSNTFDRVLMMSSKRSKFEVWSEILESCLRKPRTQTWLLRKTRLKTKSIKENIQFLLSRNLVEEIEELDIVKFQTTDKGEEALVKYYSLIIEFFELDQKKEQ